jgi:hypothetical protein
MLVYLALSLYLFTRPALGSEPSPSSVLISSLRLERITRLVQAYRPTPLPVFSCPELSANLKLENLPGEGAETLVMPGETTPKLTWGFAWDEEGFYAALKVRSQLEAPPSGDLVRIGLMEAGAGEAKTARNYILSAGGEGLQLRPASGDSAPPPTLVSSMIPDGYRGEIKFPWPSLAPATPFSEGLILTLQSLSPGAAPATPPKQCLLLLIPNNPGEVRGYLSLAGPGPGAESSGKVIEESLEGQLALRSPEPREIKLRLQIFRLAEVREEEIARITQGVRLEQGINTFRFYWDASEAPAGNYLLQAVAAAGDKELFSRRLPFTLAHRQPGGQ